MAVCGRRRLGRPSFGWRGRGAVEKDVDDRLQALVSELQRRGCVRTEAVAAAFAVVPRHLFLPSRSRGRAYAVDEAIPTHFDQDGVSISSSSAPTIMAVMLEMLSVDPETSILEIGAGTGYNAALLARLVGPSGHVVSIDVNPVVAVEAQANVHALAPNVDVVTGDGWVGLADETFDRIIVTAECWDMSPHWVDQLRDGGMLVLPLWLRPALTFAVGFQKTGRLLESRSLAYCGFMPLQGPHSGPPRRTTVYAWPDPSGINPETRMIAVLDDASADRVTALERLVRETPVVTPVPPSKPGWNVRIALGQSDSIAFAGLSGQLRRAVGLFDVDENSLAVVEGEHVVSFGGPACRERLVRLLHESDPIDAGALRINAIPHRSPPERSGDEQRGPSGLLIERPSFDLLIDEVPQQPNP
jgi:protein-L-isoaspartate(D-aspartate) O-methyltransferase